MGAAYPDVPVDRLRALRPKRHDAALAPPYDRVTGREVDVSDIEGDDLTGALARRAEDREADRARLRGMLDG